MIENKLKKFGKFDANYANRFSIKIFNMKFNSILTIHSLISRLNEIQSFAEKNISLMLRAI
jgi:hypothetical protein